MLIELALRNLARTKVRSTLAMIGIVIGVMAISAIGIFGESLKAVVLENFKDLANEVIITPSYTHGYSSIDERTVQKIEKLPYSSEVIPVKSSSTLIRFKDKRTYVKVYGMEIDKIRNLFKLEKGSYRGCLIGGRIADFFKLRVGSKIEISDEKFRIGGILREEARFDINPNFALIISIRDFDRVFGGDYKIVIVRVKDLDKIDEFKEAVERTINRRDKVVSVFEMKTIIERIESAFAKVTTFLMAIASVSLLVAGISILNIMLISTMERIREIGLMRAIGAYRETILKIFLTEALILGLIGSVVGGVLSFVSGYIIDLLILKTTKYVFQLSSLAYVFIGISFGIATALISALYPAWKASRLEPIEALRYE